MTNQDRNYVIWQLLNEKHHGYCVENYSRQSAKSPLVLPEDETQITGKALAAKEYYERLLTLSDADLAKEVEDCKAQMWAKFEAKHKFNQANALATSEVFDFWSRAEYWSIEEAAALINRRNPAVVTNALIPNDRSGTAISLALKQTLDLLERARAMGTLYHSNRPVDLIQWARLKHMEMPVELVELALERGKTVFDLTAEVRRLTEKLAAIELKDTAAALEAVPSKRENSLGTRERQSLLKLFIGLALTCYGHEPQAANSIKVSEIKSDLELRGISFDEDTIRKYLNEAKSLLPGE